MQSVWGVLGCRPNWAAEKSQFENVRIGPIRFHLMVTAFGRSRPAADASREVVERWLLDGLM